MFIYIRIWCFPILKINVFSLIILLFSCFQQRKSSDLTLFIIKSLPLRKRLPFFLRLVEVSRSFKQCNFFWGLVTFNKVPLCRLPECSLYKGQLSPDIYLVNGSIVAWHASHIIYFRNFTLSLSSTVNFIKLLITLPFIKI